MGSIGKAVQSAAVVVVLEIVDRSVLWRCSVDAHGDHIDELLDSGDSWEAGDLTIGLDLVEPTSDASVVFNVLVRLILGFKQ